MQKTKKAKKSKIAYPFMHRSGQIDYVGEDNAFIQAAKEYSREHSLDQTMPTGSVIVRDGKIIGYGANGSDYHKNNVCERVRLNVPTGQGYELCEGCSPKNHSEPRAIADAKKRENKTDGAELYLWGHWWCCEPCWDAMLKAGIKKVYLQEDSEHLFNKLSPRNIVGNQFA